MHINLGGFDAVIKSPSDSQSTTVGMGNLESILWQQKSPSRPKRLRPCNPGKTRVLLLCVL